MQRGVWVLNPLFKYICTRSPLVTLTSGQGNSPLHVITGLSPIPSTSRKSQPVVQLKVCVAALTPDSRAAKNRNDFIITAYYPHHFFDNHKNKDKNKLQLAMLPLISCIIYFFTGALVISEQRVSAKTFQGANKAKTKN